ncbi:MAG: hypothetical protein KGJ79_18555 [Alphaproteobacteria bacterium]|nr:hypothetical protein [Alphaproteobacteria bacterium]MDE2113137.1 hypothetical protein [Alphaproteobacteria bacterium]MDE2494608.1 hypothetical protein [Alphaproteobacteria bacterium]
MKIRTVILTSLACLMLAGCYESKTNLLDPAQARQPIASNDDWRDTRKDTTYHDRLNVRSDGWYDFSEAKINKDGTEGNWETHTVLLNDLGNSRGWTLYVYTTWDNDEKAYVYGIVAISNGVWRSAQPSCDTIMVDNPPELAIARQAGATADKDSGICEFTSTASLLQALQNYANTDEFWKSINRTD